MKGWVGESIFTGLLALTIGFSLAGSAADPEIDLVFTQMPVTDPTPSPGGDFLFRSIPPDGSRIVRYRVDSDGEPRVLTTAFAAAADP